MLPAFRREITDRVFEHQDYLNQEISCVALLFVVTLLLRGHCVPQPAPTQFHRPECGDRKNVTNYVCGAHTVISRRRERRLEQLAHLFRRSGSRGARIELFDRVERREALRRRIFHRVKIIIGK